MRDIALSRYHIMNSVSNNAVNAVFSHIYGVYHLNFEQRYLLFGQKSAHSALDVSNFRRLPCSILGLISSTWL